MPVAQASELLVATVIASQCGAGLDAHTLDRVVRAFSPREGPNWLAPEVAVDVVFTAPAADLRALADTARKALAGAPVDVVVQPVSSRRKKLLLADMDSTMIGQECIDELAEHVGMKRQVAAITERAMRGEIEFAAALRERVALLKGLPAAAIDEVIDTRIHVTPGARALVGTMRRHGAHTCLVTGGFTQFTARIAGMIGFDENRANTLCVDGKGRLTGEVVEPIFGRAEKLATLIELARKHNLTHTETLAVGDGANDIPMIEAAGLGVAYHGKPKAMAAAAARVEHADLTALLYAQGYRRDEFASDDRACP